MRALGIAAAAAVHTFGDYLLFHPHIHILAADGLFDAKGKFHTMPADTLGPTTEHFRHRLPQALLAAKLISHHKATELLNWEHSGFHIQAGDFRRKA